MQKLTRVQVSILSALALVLTSLTIVLGGAPLFVLRLSMSAPAYYVGGIVVALCMALFKLWTQALIFLMIVLLIGLYIDLSKKIKNKTYSAVLSAGLTTAVCYSLASAWLTRQGLTLSGVITTQIKEFITTMSQMNSQLNLDPEALVSQIPSGILVLMLVTLAIAVVFEKTINSLLKVEDNRKEKLLDFSVPNYFIWIVMFTFLGSFFNFNRHMIEVVSINILNIMLVFYFFHGMAIVACFFERYKVGTLWQMFGYFLLLSQFFIFASILGVLDFWFEFRNKWSKPNLANS